MRLFLAVAALSASFLPAQAQSPASSPGSPTTLTLAEAIARVRDRLPAIAAARERDRAAAAARQRVAALPNPLVELRGENFGAVPADRLPRDVFATVTQPVELGGKRGARRADADAAADVASAEVSTLEWQVAFDVAEAYVDALRLRETRTILADQERSITDIVGLLSERVREGVAPEADLRKFDTERTRLASQLTRVSIRLQSTLLRLAALIGQPVQADQLQAPAVPPVTRDPATLGDASLEARADIRAALARVARADTAAALERTRRMPDLLVTAGYKRTSGYDTAVAGVSVPIALFDRNGAAIARAAGEAAAARHELQQLREQALADAKAYWIAARELSAGAGRARTDLLEPAGIVRSAARAAFVEGRTDLLALVDAERVFGEASQEALELQLDAVLAVIQAQLAIGESPLP